MMNEINVLGQKIGGNANTEVSSWNGSFYVEYFYGLGIGEESRERVFESRYSLH